MLTSKLTSITDHKMHYHQKMTKENMIIINCIQTIVQMMFLLFAEESIQVKL